MAVERQTIRDMRDKVDQAEGVCCLIATIMALLLLLFMLAVVIHGYIG